MMVLTLFLNPAASRGIELDLSSAAETEKESDVSAAFSGEQTILPVQVTATAAPAAMFPVAIIQPSRVAELASPAELAWKRRWLISLAPLTASQALDAASSYGMRELNPLLAGADGSFGTKATAMKFGAIGGLIGAEFLLVRKYPRSAKLFSILNWAAAGTTTAFAVHNFRLK